MKALKSRTVWTLIITFLTNGFIAVQGDFDPNTVMVVNAILTGLAAYFKVNPSQKY
jgi:hypothetical protein